MPGCWSCGVVMWGATNGPNIWFAFSCGGTVAESGGSWGSTRRRQSKWRRGRTAGVDSPAWFPYQNKQTEQKSNRGRETKEKEKGKMKMKRTRGRV